MIAPTLHREITLRSMLRAPIVTTSALAILAILVSLPVESAPDPNEALVHAWVAAAIEPKTRPSERDSNIGRAMKPTGVMIAWQRLKRCRDAGNARDPNLTAAEHYLFGRFVAGENGDTRYRDIPDLYESVKSAATKPGAESAAKGKRKPPPPTDKKVAEWVRKGVEKGLEDYESWSGHKAGPGTDDWATVLGTTAFKYARYSGSGQTNGEARCEVRLQ